MSNLLNLFDRHLATVGNTFTEQLVAATDVFVKQCELFSIEWTGHRAEGSQFVGLYLIKFDAQLVSQQTAEIGEHAVDADAAGDRRRVTVDVVGTTADIVTARCSIATHRNHNRFPGLEVLYGVPDLLRRIGRTTR